MELGHVPKICKLLVDDPFFDRVQEINDLIARRAYELFESSGQAHSGELPELPGVSDRDAREAATSNHLRPDRRKRHCSPIGLARRPMDRSHGAVSYSESGEKRAGQ